MAQGPTSSRPGRALLAVLVVVLALYAAVAFGSTKTPKLGLDLRGGTSAILTATAPHGGKVTTSALAKAVDIIRQRVNGLGVAEADVSTQGNSNVIVSVPGKGRDEVVKLIGQTAELRFRAVLAAAAGTATPSPSASPSPSPSPSSSSAKPKASASPHARALSSALLAASATPTPAAPSASASASPAAGATSALAKAEAQFAALNCANPQARAGAGGEDPSIPIAACSADGSEKYLLAPAQILGTEIASAQANLNSQTNQWEVDLNLKRHGADTFGKITTAVTKLPDIPNCQPPTGCNAVAIVLDGVVQSAPRIVQPILGGQAQISGNFSEKEAKDLANVLKYGALPLKFTTQSVDSVSPTLGSDQLRGGLIAGAIGLGLVVLYLLLYYRGLGVVAIASLVLSGILLYAATTLLGHFIGYTLSLAGIAGFIVAVGITADSFVVLFERLRDEVREGRTLRSGVDRAWPRARRTIISADTVSLLAAVVLYIFSVGSVRGFAFTLGLSTVSDLFIVFLFTKPLITIMARSRSFGSGAGWTGLGSGRMGGAPGLRRGRRTPAVVDEGAGA